VKEARQSCKNAEEIVLALPRDIDREKPKKGKGVRWHSDAKKAAAPATLTVFHGRTLAEQLDSVSQDLRREHLGIPFSRLSWQAVIAGCHESSVATIGRLTSLGRYDPKHYVDREADERLFNLWQQGLRNAAALGRRDERRVLLPLVADSGIGKTSLLSQFVERTLPIAPVLLLPARDLSLHGSTALVRDVLERLQGAIDANLQSSEEAHLAAMLKGKTPLTVVVDGLDETKNDAGVRQSIDGWIRSPLGQSAILIVSSRPEFWRKCRDATWASSILYDDDRRHANSLRHQQELSALDPLRGVQLPGKFSSHELVLAWTRNDRTEDEFWQLPSDVRKEIQHPFTLRSAVELLAAGATAADLNTRSGIMSLWIRKRLKLEADATSRITESLYRESLLRIAEQAETLGGSWISVDQLKDVPRLDTSRPPGEVVERLIAANVLETHPEQHDHIRFSFEAVYDFFLAEAKLHEIEKDPQRAATTLAELPFSRAVTLLERIGHQITSHSCREEFATALAALDAPKAAALLRASPASYSAGCRAFIVSRLSEMLDSRMEAERALATELLGRLVCRESAEALEIHWSGKTPSRRLHAVVSIAAISHGLNALVPLVFRTSWFTRDDFFVDLRPELSATCEDFRKALAAYAYQFISAKEHSDDYRRALTLLAYLGDDRAADAIEERTLTCEPYFYESACLLAIGSPTAIQVYSALVDRYLDAEQKGLEKEAREHYWSAVAAFGCSIGNLATRELEDYAVKQIQSEVSERRILGRQLAEKIGSERMLSLVVAHWSVDGYLLPGPSGFGRHLGPEWWLKLWNEDATVGRRRVLIRIASALRDPRIENTLIHCLSDPKLAGESAHSLAAIGSERACLTLRRMLVPDQKADDRTVWNQSAALLALARLRDPASVTDVVRFLESPQGANEYFGTVALAAIGTPEAEQALLNLNHQKDELHVRGLVSFGSRKCVERAVEIARRHAAGAAWLLTNCRFCLRFNGWSRHDFRTDVDVEPLLSYLRESELTQESYEDLNSLIDGIDTPVVRTLLRTWCDLRNMPHDVVLKPREETKLSDVGFRELAERGDEHVLAEFVKNEVHHWKGHLVPELAVRNLRVFDQEGVRAALREILEIESDERARITALDMIGPDIWGKCATPNSSTIMS
jgi:hypothetical protein